MTILKTMQLFGQTEFLLLTIFETINLYTSSGLFKNNFIYKLSAYKSYIYVYACVYNQELALNNSQELICCKTQHNQTKSNQTNLDP